MTKTIVPEILSKLELYLEEIDKLYESQSENSRVPTLPHTSDGKVNVRKITLAIGLRQSQEQHFFKKPELASAVNAIATIQGLKKIGSRMLDDAQDDIVTARLARVSNDKNELAKTLAAREAEIEALREKIKSLKARINFFETTGLMVHIDQN